MGKNVELPGAFGRCPKDLSLEANSINSTAHCRLERRQVAVGLVIGAPDDFQPALGYQPAQLLPPVRVEVPERLQVVDFGQHELVVGVQPGPLEMGLDEHQPRVLERVPSVLRPYEVVPP